MLVVYPEEEEDMAHHVLADGFSLLQLFVLDIGVTKEVNVAQPHTFAQKRDGWGRKCESLFAPLYMFLRAPMDLGTSMVDVFSYNHNGWYVSEEQLARRLNSAMASTISVTKVKEVKNLLGCSFATALLAMYTGALR